MASNITLSAGVRQNLLSLQSTAQLMSQTQNRLATGKKVNSALDNPLNFFTSQSLNNRASDLNSLLDSIGQAQQTLKAADQGLTSLTKLVESAKSIAKQAQQAAAPTATYSLSITGNTAIAADTSRSVSGNTFASLAGLTASSKSTYTIDTNALATASVEGDTFTLSNGTNTYVFEDDTAGDGVTGGSIAFTDKASLKTALSSIFGSGYGVAADTVTITGADYTTNFAAATGSVTTGISNANASDGDKLTITQGSTTETFRYVASGASAGARTFTTLSDLNSAINGSSIGNSGGPALAATVLASDDGSGHLKLETDGTTSFLVGGSLSGAGFLNNAGSFDANYNSTLAGLTGSFSVTVGSGSAQSISLSANNTKAKLATALGNLTGVNASINGSNFVSITSSSADDVTIAGTGTGASGLFNNTNIGVNSPTVSAGTSSTVRSSLQTQYNDLLTQIDALASDASYNGINLLNNDDLKVVFNEVGTSSLTINGVDFDSTGLGLSNLSGNEFQNNASIDTVVAGLDDALNSLRAQAANFGTNLSTVQTRQDFTKNLVATLQSGADNLVLADTNEEGANLLALQTRQQLSTTALSLSAQADQAVLRLF